MVFSNNTLNRTVSITWQLVFIYSFSSGSAFIAWKVSKDGVINSGDCLARTIASGKFCS